MNTDQKPMYEWNTINWKKVETTVFKLQKRIYQASRKGNTKTVHQLQKLLLKSCSAKLLATRRVTQDNQGKKTAGIDGVKSLTPSQRIVVSQNLTLSDKAKPLRRVWIPKPGSTEKRPLGIPIMRDRATQALVKLGLEPEWEAKFEANSYGFRPGRGAHDAIAAIFESVKFKPKYVLDADLEKCFDRINHQKLLEKVSSFPTLHRLINQWLKAGVMEQTGFTETTAGTPQGGVISPLLANIALHGMEQYLKKKFPRKKHTSTGNVNPVKVIRYADDFLVLHEKEEVIKQCRELLAGWLGELGLQMKESKTSITHTFQPTTEGKVGFDFLGMHVRQYEVGKNQTGHLKGKPLGFKTLIKPSKKSIKKHSLTLQGIIRNNRSISQKRLIEQLNPVITGWCNYFSTVVAKDTFNSMDNLLFIKLRRWAFRRHTRKTRTWIAHKYWLLKKEGNNWTFGLNKGYHLRFHKETKIKRHIKVQNDKSPYDGNWTYWSSRLGRYPTLPGKKAFLLRKQMGKCALCGLSFRDSDLLELDHITPTSKQGKDNKENWQLLHRHCHDTKTALDNKAGLPNGYTYEEPYA